MNFVIFMVIFVEFVMFMLVVVAIEVALMFTVVVKLMAIAELRPGEERILVLVLRKASLCRHLYA